MEFDLDAQTIWERASGWSCLKKILGELKDTIAHGQSAKHNVRWAIELSGRFGKIDKSLEQASGKAYDAWPFGFPDVPSELYRSRSPEAIKALEDSARKREPPVVSEIRDVCLRRLGDAHSGRLEVPPAGMEAMSRFIDLALEEAVRQRINDGQLYLPLSFLNECRARFGERQWVQAVTKACVANHNRLKFPWKKTFLRPHVDTLFGNLQKFQPVYDHSPFSLKAPPIRFKSGDFLPLALDGKYTQLTISEGGEEYNSMDILADYFTEEPRINARQRSQERSPAQFWQDKEWVGQLLAEKALPAAINRTYVCPYGDEFSDGLTTFVLRECVFNSRVKECTQFKPSLALSVIKLFKGTRVLDFSAGWGDRLLGAMASDATHYLAFDPNTTLYGGHTEMKYRFLASDPERLARFNVVYEPAERGPLPDDFTCDLIFTSPPFFDFEVYTELPGQSIAHATSVPDWLVRFLFVCLNRFWKRLDVGGHMVIHLNDARGMIICEPMCLFAEAHLEGCRFMGVLGAMGGVSRKTRPLWVFKKEPESAKTPRQCDAAKHLARHYDAVARILSRVDLDQLGRPVPKRSRDDADATDAAASAATGAAEAAVAMGGEGEPAEANPSKRLMVDDTPVTLAPLRKLHRGAIEPIVQDPRVMSWMGQGASGWPSKKIDNTFKYCEADLQLPPTERTHFYWAVSKGSQVVGLVFVHNVTYHARASDPSVRAPPFVVPEAHGRKPFFFSILLAAEVHGRGVGTAATRLCIAAFRELNPAIRQLYADVHVGNEGSCKLLKKVGFREMPSTVWIGQVECSRWVLPLS